MTQVRAARCGHDSGTGHPRAGPLGDPPGHGDAAYRTDSLQTAAIEVALAVLCLLVAARDARQRLQALAMSLPLAAAALAAFRLVGFGQ